jgi:hypothetical protein
LTLTVKRHYHTFEYSWLGEDCSEDDIEQLWKNSKLGDLGNILCTIIGVEKRLDVGDPQEPVNFYSEAPSHPIHVLYKNVLLEQKISQVFRTAFKTNLILNRGGGKMIAFHVGETPDFGPEENGFTPSYFERLRKIPFLHNQGHGMRSFAGCILHVFTSPAFIQLLDEPEAFLHPPHARLLAGILGRSVPTDRQLVIATHSGDFLRGLLDANTPNLRIIRLTREGSINRVHELDSPSIRNLWADPLLRFSNVLDAIFHDGVVICESDSDCRFYSAVMNATFEHREEISPDIMFAASGGKDRMPVLIQALQKLGVKIRVIADFDVLRDEGTLSAIVRSLGGNWDLVEPGWKALITNIRSQTPPLSLNQVRERIHSALNEEKTASLSDITANKIKEALRSTSSWHYAKLAGINALPSGQPRAELDLLLRHLEQFGLFIVKCGEIERFAPSLGAHGPKWVAQALEKDLASDPELESARAFITEVFGIGPAKGWSHPRNQNTTKPAEMSHSEPSSSSQPPPSRLPFWRPILKVLGLD